MGLNWIRKTPMLVKGQSVEGPLGTPQRIRAVERNRQYILNVAIASLFQANLPLIFWSECSSSSDKQNSESNVVEQ